MEKLGTILGILLSLLSLGSAFDSFTAIGLLPKLSIAAAAALIVVFRTAYWFAEHLRPSGASVGFGVPVPDRSKRRFALFSGLLALLCILFVLLALWLTQRFTLQLRETTEVDRSATLLIAPYASVDSVSIELPRKQDASCDWQNRSQGDLPPLAAQMVGWNSPTPQLHIDDFVYPQRVEIDCKPARVIRGGIIVPARTVIYLADDLRIIRFAIIAVGGLIWFVACWAVWLWSE